MTITEAPTTIQSDLTTRAQALVESPHWDKVQDPAKSVIMELLETGKLYGSTNNLIGVAERIVQREATWLDSTGQIQREALSLMANTYWYRIDPEDKEHRYDHHMVLKAADGIIYPGNIEQIKECISRVAKMLENYEREARSPKPTPPVNFHVKGTPPKTKKKKVSRAHSIAGHPKGSNQEIPYKK